MYNLSSDRAFPDAMFSPSAVILICQWIIRIVMIPVVMRNRRPTAAMAWLLVIFFEPTVGLIAYLLLGNAKLPRKRIREHRSVARAVQTLVRLAEQQPHIITPPIDEAHRPLAVLTERVGEMPCVGGNSFELFDDTDEALSAIIADIDAAEHHAHLMFYIYEDDESGHRVFEALCRAVKRGVACRVLADAVGSWGMLRSLAPRMTAAGIEVRAMLPVNPLRRRLARMDLRNHRKLAVIDGRIAHTGSQNIVNADYGRRRLKWHDVMVRVRGPVVPQLQLVFMEDWYFETDEVLEGPHILPPPRTAGPYAIQAVPTGPTYPAESMQNLIVGAVHHAREHVIIASPYLVPNEPFLTALEVATMRGVTVDIIVPIKSDHRLVSAAGRAYFGDMLDAGVNLYLHSHGLLHSKIMTIDHSLAMIGSGNFDIRSFRLNLELNLLLYGDEATRQIGRLLDRYVGESVPLIREHWAKRPLGRRFVEDTAKLLSPLL